MHITERLPRESSRDYALRIIKDNIISLRLEPGSQISENELAHPRWASPARRCGRR